MTDVWVKVGARAERFKSSGRLRLWLAWAIASAAGGAPVGVLVGSLGILSSLVLGPLFALPQWLILRSYIPSASRWLIMSGLGTLCGSAVALLVGVTGFPLAFIGPHIGKIAPISLTMVDAILAMQIFGVAGLIYGILQWLALRAQMRRSYLWIVISPLGVLAFWLVLALMGVNDLTGASRLDSNFWMKFSAGSAAGAAYGVTTGFTLTWLLPRKTDGNTSAAVPRSKWHLPPGSTVEVAVALILLGVATFGLLQSGTKPEVVFELPSGYRGWVLVEYGRPDCPAGQRDLIRVNESGCTCISHAKPEGPRRHAYWNSDDSKMKFDSGDSSAQSTISAAATGRSRFPTLGVREYEIFFVGTESELQQSWSPRPRPSPKDDRSCMG